MKTTCKEIAAQTLKLLTNESKQRNAAQQSVVYTMLLMWQEKLLPQVDLTKAYKAQGRVEQQKRNDAILHHVFEVTILETDEKTQRQRYVVKPDLGFSLGTLKTRINRSLAVVAYVIQTAQRVGGLNKVVRPNKDSTLTLSGEAYYSEEDRENAPNLAKNWVALSGRVHEGHGTFERIQRVADKSLGYQRAVTRRRKVQETDIGELPIAVIAKALREKLASIGEDARISKWERDELRMLVEVSEHVIETVKPLRAARKAAKAKRGKQPKRGMIGEQPVAMQ
jgi:hypothetical protein